ncbi:hypothetical protein [Xenorhabdus sp. SGI246]|uniref:hypothetical protein n=1 Tax=Xenorhabdus sp. SGI246 TaxID=3158263 RepID=UPI00349FCD5F
MSKIFLMTINGKEQSAWGSHNRRFIYEQEGKPIVYLDESGFAQSMPRIYGYSEKGRVVLVHMIGTRKAALTSLVQFSKIRSSP